MPRSLVLAGRHLARERLDALFFALLHQFQQPSTGIVQVDILLDMLPRCSRDGDTFSLVLEVVLYHLRHVFERCADEMLSRNIGIRTIDRLRHHEGVVGDAQKEPQARHLTGRAGKIEQDLGAIEELGTGLPPATRIEILLKVVFGCKKEKGGVSCR